MEQWDIFATILLWEGLLMLKEYRLRKGISQEKLEEITGLDRKTIFRIENDLNLPVLDNFSKLVEALDLTDEEIAKEVRMVLHKEKHK